MFDFDLICCVTNCGHGSRALKIAKHHGVKGGTIFLGSGTVKNRLLDILDLNDIRKEIVIMAAERDVAHDTLHHLSREMAFHKPHHGIAFSFSLNNYIGTRHCEYFDIDENKAVKETMYQAIFTVVDKGLAEEVIEAANKAGARGGTIINARGSGIHDHSVLFSMPIEPEKEIVMILAPDERVKVITTAIRENLLIDEPGHGMLFTVAIDEAVGLYRE